MKKTKKIATSLDVAELAGVSQSAVSRCFTKGASISSRTKLRVREAAKKLGYKAQTFLKNSVGEDSGLVGVILPYITNRFYPEVLTELHEALRLRGYRILLITTDDSEELDEKLIQPYLKEKLIAAHRAGIKEVLIPKENEKDLVDMPKKIIDEIKITPVEYADEVLKIALTKELKKTEWVEVDMSKKDDKSQASIQ